MIFTHVDDDSLVIDYFKKRGMKPKRVEFRRDDTMTVHFEGIPKKMNYSAASTKAIARAVGKLQEGKKENA